MFCHYICLAGPAFLSFSDNLPILIFHLHRLSLLFSFETLLGTSNQNEASPNASFGGKLPPFSLHHALITIGFFQTVVLVCTLIFSSLNGSQALPSLSNLGFYSTLLFRNLLIKQIFLAPLLYHLEKSYSAAQNQYEQFDSDTESLTAWRSSFRTTLHSS